MKFYTNSVWFISEQLAFALILQKRTEISSAEHFVLHYWGAQQNQQFGNDLDDRKQQAAIHQKNQRPQQIAIYTNRNVLKYRGLRFVKF